MKLFFLVKDESLLTRNLVISRNEPIALKRQLSRNFLGKLNPAAINLPIDGQGL